MLYKTVDMLIFYNDAAGKIFLYCLFCIKQTFETVHNKQDISTFLQLYSNILKESGEAFCLFNKRLKRLKCLFPGKKWIFYMIYRRGCFDIENRLAVDGKYKCKKNGYPHGNGKPLEGTPPQCPRASAARAAAAGQEKRDGPLTVSGTVLRPPFLPARQEREIPGAMGNIKPLLAFGKAAAFAVISRSWSQSSSGSAQPRRGSRYRWGQGGCRQSPPYRKAGRSRPPSGLPQRPSQR